MFHHFVGLVLKELNNNCQTNFHNFFFSDRDTFDLLKKKPKKKPEDTTVNSKQNYLPQVENFAMSDFLEAKVT